MSFTNSTQKRKPVPASKAQTKRADGVGNSQKGNNERDKQVTVFNSTLDKNLITVDAYKDKFGKVINNLYDYSTTFDLGTLSSLVQGGLGMFSKVTGALQQAKQIKDAIQSGNFADALNKIAPGASNILKSAGIPQSTIDTFIGAAGIAIKVNGVVQDVRSGNLNLLDGANALGKAITGQDIAFIKDIQNSITAVSVIANEFTQAGLSLKSAWGDLVSSKPSGSIEFNYNQEVFNNMYPIWSQTGDYETMLVASELSSTEHLEAVTGNVLDKLLAEFSLSSVFNSSKTSVQAFEDVMKVVYSLRGKDALWVDRDAQRKGFGLYQFMNASDDFKEAAKAYYADKFYHAADVKKTYPIPYANVENESLISMVALFEPSNVKDELRTLFGGVVINETTKTSNYVTPFEFQNN